MRYRFEFLFALLTSVSSPVFSQQATAQLPPRPPLLPYGVPITFDQAKKVAAAAEAEAMKEHVPVVIAITDLNGEILYYEQLDGVAKGIGEVALKKARFTVRFRMPTNYVQATKMAGYDGNTRLPDAVASGGGFPLTFQGKTIGGIGVSGSTDGAIESRIAEAGQAALQ